ncbi:hypothetical protein [Streptomyces albidoflavus]|uniref:hypothetical protein n=1 Tax=Streptomyces albidoflavus TaxID=1886 RepID=UPI00159673EC|nr:hypothetical protein [Streptomyces albidoflavus]
MHEGLNERQRDVLDWVGQGCPEGVWPDSTHKVSAQALQSRGLIKVTKRRGHWNAQLTDRGRQCLADGDTTTVQKVRTNYTDQLLEELRANNNILIKPVESGPHAVNWASRVSAARQSGKIPHTQEIRGKQTYRGYEIKLVDIPAWRLAELTPVPVPARLTCLHSVVTALQNQAQIMGLTTPVQVRALRIVQAHITAAESQGHTAAFASAQGASPSHRRRSAPPHFTITAHGTTVGFRVLQEQNRSAHIATDKELAEAKKHTWMRIPRFDYSPSDRLRFILIGGAPHRATEWADLPGRPLEIQLAEIAQEVTLRGEAAERQSHADQKARETEQQRREVALQKARDAYTHAHRVRHLREQADAWHQGKRLAEFITAVRKHAGSLPTCQEKVETEAWLAFADAHLQHVIEAATAPRLATPPEPSTADLQPYLADAGASTRPAPTDPKTAERNAPGADSDGPSLDRENP